MIVKMEQMICALCGSRWHPLSSEPPHMEPCISCRVLTTVPPPTRDVFGDGLFEQGSYAGKRLKRRRQWMREAAVRLDWVQTYLQDGYLLEIGSATGEFVALAAGRGFEVVGLEASPWAAKASRDLTAHVQQADPGAWLANHQQTFDAIAFFHTLEHVHEPLAFLTPIVAALAPDGRIFIEVPNADARDARDGEGWCHSSLEEHVLHYRPQDLGALLSKVGLAVVSLTSHTMRELDTPLIWAIRRLRWLSRGRVRPSQDILRVVACHA